MYTFRNGGILFVIGCILLGYTFRNRIDTFRNRGILFVIGSTLFVIGGILFVIGERLIGASCAYIYVPRGGTRCSYEDVAVAGKKTGQLVCIFVLCVNGTERRLSPAGRCDCQPSARSCLVARIFPRHRRRTDPSAAITSAPQPPCRCSRSYFPFQRRTIWSQSPVCDRGTAGFVQLELS